MNRTEFEEFIKDTYGVTADYPWNSDSTTAVFRHEGNKKWFALAMLLHPSRLGLEGDTNVWAVNLKCPSAMIGAFLQEKGVFPAYHMNKSHWITVLIDVVDRELFLNLIDISFELTAEKIKKKRGAK